MEARKKRQEELDRLREEEQQRTIQELNKQCELFYMANLDCERRRQQDDRLIPCDGLLFVNDINLENAFLDATFQVLKGTARGLVQIGVAKPHPVSLNESATNGAPELQASFPPHH